jgi:hypothetical protein
VRAGVDGSRHAIGSRHQRPARLCCRFAIGAALAGLAGVVGGTAQPFGQEKDIEFPADLTCGCDHGWHDIISSLDVRQIKQEASEGLGPATQHLLDLVDSASFRKPDRR